MNVVLHVIGPVVGTPPDGIAFCGRLLSFSNTKQFPTY